jgi:hypothetical protein
VIFLRSTTAAAVPPLEGRNKWRARARVDGARAQRDGSHLVGVNGHAAVRVVDVDLDVRREDVRPRTLVQEGLALLSAQRRRVGIKDKLDGCQRSGSRGDTGGCE